MSYCGCMQVSERDRRPLKHVIALVPLRHTVDYRLNLDLFTEHITHAFNAPLHRKCHFISYHVKVHLIRRTEPFSPNLAKLQHDKTDGHNSGSVI